MFVSVTQLNADEQLTPPFWRRFLYLTRLARPPLRYRPWAEKELLTEEDCLGPRVGQAMMTYLLVAPTLWLISRDVVVSFVLPALLAVGKVASGLNRDLRAGELSRLEKSYRAKWAKETHQTTSSAESLQEDVPPSEREGCT